MPSWVVLEPFGAVLTPSGAVLGPSRAVSDSLGAPGGSSGLSEMFVYPVLTSRKVSPDGSIYLFLKLFERVIL